MPFLDIDWIIPCSFNVFLKYACWYCQPWSELYRIRYSSDRENEFKNRIIEEVLETFDIRRTLSYKGCPYDNAVAEATYKIIKTEFAFNKRFESLEELELELFDYVNWYNNVRIHGSLGYKTPIEFRMFS